MTTFSDLPCDVIDLIYRKIHEQNLQNVLVDIKTRQTNMISRVNRIIKDIRKYVTSFEFYIESELLIHKCLYALGILTKS